MNKKNEALDTSDCDNQYYRLIGILQLILQLVPIFLVLCFVMGMIGIMFDNTFIGILCGFLLCLFFSLNLLNNAIKSKELIQKYPERKANHAHHAIILAHYSPPDEKGNYKLMDYFDGVDIIIKNFQEKGKNVNYKVYEINSKSDAQKIICDPKTTSLWIFGHGKRNILQFESDNLCYYEVRKAKKMDFIGQFHCNSYLGKSLADYNNPNSSYVTRWPQFSPLIRMAVRDRIETIVN